MSESVRIVVTHLTRMQPGFVCIAGIDPMTGRHIRPVVSGRRLRRDEIQFGRHELGIGTEIDLGPVKPVPSRPEVEDHAFYPALMTRIKTWEPAEVADLLARHAQHSLAAVFGPDLERDGQTASMAEGSGRASLGCLALTSSPSITVNQFEKVKLVIDDADGVYVVAVTDLRLYELDQTTPDRAAIERVRRSLAKGHKVFLSVGLSRPFARDGELPRHWLQVNNIHLFPSAT